MKQILKLLSVAAIAVFFSCEKESKPFVDHCYSGYQVNQDSTDCVCPPETHWEHLPLERCYEKDADIFVITTENIPCLVPDNLSKGARFDYSKAVMRIDDRGRQKEAAFISNVIFEQDLIKNTVDEHGNRDIQIMLGGLLGWPSWLDCDVFVEQFGDDYKHVEGLMESIRTEDNNKKIDFRVIYRFRSPETLEYEYLDTGYVYAVKPW